MNKTSVELMTFMNEKDGLLYSRSSESGSIHQSFLLGDGRVLVFESIPENYPSNALCLFESIQAYFEAIRDVSWIVDLDNIIKDNSNFDFEALEEAY